MKNSIFTIVLLLGTVFAFAQEAQSTVSKHAINTKGTGGTKTKIILQENEMNSVEVLEVVKTKSNQSNDKTSSNQTTENQSTGLSSEIILTSEKKHTKSGHVTLLK